MCSAECVLRVILSLGQDVVIGCETRGHLLFHEEMGYMAPRSQGNMGEAVARNKKSSHETRELFRKTGRNQGPAAWAAGAVGVYFKSKPLDNFVWAGEGFGENHKDSNSRICKIVTPHLTSVIRE